MAFSERAFIRRLQQFPVRFPVTVGIGDDGAVIDCGSVSKQIVVTDMLIDGVHFESQSASAYEIGYKSIAVNLSDLAAMTARPTAAFVSLALPSKLASDGAFLESFYAALDDASQEFGFTLAGGDTNRIDGPLVINVCLVGVPMNDQTVLRSGAKPGDILVVTGPLGGSLKSGRHLKPIPRLDAAEWVSENCGLHALMDVSDGLSLDLHRMVEESQTGAVLELENIPIHADVCSRLSANERLQKAFSDGEDFELLMAIAPNQVDRQQLTERGYSVIGVVNDRAGEIRLRTESGEFTQLVEAGFQHL